MPGNRNGDSYNFQSLQDEAVRRAREMQARAHIPSFEPSAPERVPSPPQSEPNLHTEQLPIHNERPPAPSPAPQDPAEKPAEELGPGFLDSLLKDNERTLIWVLLLILLEEKADTTLLLALMYLAT